MMPSVLHACLSHSHDAFRFPPCRSENSPEDLWELRRPQLLGAVLGLFARSLNIGEGDLRGPKSTDRFPSELCLGLLLLIPHPRPRTDWGELAGT